MSRGRDREFNCYWRVCFRPSTVPSDPEKERSIEGPTRELRIRQVITNLTVTCFVMGFGIGPLFLAPLSEIFGRKPIYCISMFFYFIFTLPSALAHVAGTLIVPRMIAGLAASAPMCNVGGTIADVWETENRGAPMGIFSGTILYVPCSLPSLFHSPTPAHPSFTA